MNILTEEELKEIELIYGLDDCRNLSVAPKLKSLFLSHRNLLSANAELKDENFDLKASVILNIRENKRLRAELEELK